MTESKEELQLQIQTIDFTPAIFTFNADQISAMLDAQLAKYQGLEFTEDKEAEAKKVIAELNKAKKLLDTYRKDMKAKLTVSVTDFENKIKELAAKFDAVIIPLTEQTAQFEADRKHKKRMEIEALVIALIVEHKLKPEFAIKLVYPEEYLNRTTSIKTITLELRAKADQLKADQDRLAAELELIKGSVDLANISLTGSPLLETTYTRLLGPLALHEVLSRITEDVTVINERAVQAAARENAKRLAAEAAVAESNRLAAESAAKVQLAPPSPTAPPVVEYAPPSPTAPPIIAPPLQPAVPSVKVEQRFVETYQVTGTQSQLDSLEAFLEQYVFEWKILEN